jgi:hypothetical protein
MIVVRLGYMRTERSRDVLLDLLDDPEVYGHAIVGLNVIGTRLVADDRVVAAVEPFVNDPRRFVRKAAMRILEKARVGHPAADGPAA